MPEYNQFGAELPVGTARLTPGQENTFEHEELPVGTARLSRNEEELSSLLAATDDNAVVEDQDFDTLMADIDRGNDFHQDLTNYGAAARKAYLTDEPVADIKETLADRFGKKAGDEIYRLTVEHWKPYKELYRRAGEYSKDETAGLFDAPIDAGYVQNLNAEDRKVFYAFLAEQATPKQRDGLGNLLERWVRGENNAWDSFERILGKLEGFPDIFREDPIYATDPTPELGKDGVPLTSMASSDPNAYVPKKGLTQLEERQAYIQDAASIRNRIRKLRESGDPALGSNLLTKGLGDIAEMGPALLGGGATAATTGPAGAMAFWTAQIAPDLEAELIDMGVPKDKAWTWALIGAIPSAAVEAAQVEGFTPGMSKAVRRGVLGYLAGYAKKFGKNWMKEVGQEGVQFIIEESSKIAALAVHKENPDIDIDDALTRGIEEMNRAGVSLGLLTAAGHLPGGFRGSRVASRLQQIHSNALLVSEKSSDLKLKQYADTLMNMIDNQTPIDEKTRGLAERVLKEAETIRLKEAISTVSEGRAEERVAEQAVTAPQKPVAKPKPEAKPEAKETEKAPPAQPARKVVARKVVEAVNDELAKVGGTPEGVVTAVNDTLQKRMALTATPTAEAPAVLTGVEAIRAAGEARRKAKQAAAAETVSVPPPAAQTSQAVGEAALKKRARARKAKTGKGIRQVALEIDNGLKKGMITQQEAEVLYEDLGRRAVELEQDPKDKKNLTNVKESLRKRLRAIKGIAAPAAVPVVQAPAPKSKIAEQERRLERLKQSEKKVNREIKRLKAEYRTASRNQQDIIAGMIDKQLAALGRDIVGLKARQKAAAADLKRARAGTQAPAPKRQAPARRAQAPTVIPSVSEPAFPVVEPAPARKAEPQALPDYEDGLYEGDYEDNPEPDFGEEEDRANAQRAQDLVARMEPAPARKADPRVIEPKGQLYHSGSLSGEGSFVHVGSAQAAQFVSEKTGAPVHVTTEKPKNPARMTDNGSVHNPARIAEGLMLANEGKDGNDWGTLNDIVRNEQKKSGDKAAYQILETVLRKWGFDGIIYENVNEDPGSTSYILFTGKEVFKPRVIEPVGSETLRMGEREVKPPPMPATEHARAQAIQELELEDQSQGEIALVMTERGINPTGMNQDQMIDAIIADAVAAGEIAPVVEGAQPEVQPRGEAVPRHKRPMPSVATSVAHVTGLSDNEVRTVRDEINSGLSAVEASHGAKDALRKYMATKAITTPQAIVRKAAESGDYGAAARSLSDVRASLKALGKKSAKLRAFRDAYRTAIGQAINEFNALEAGNVPPIIENQKAALAEQARERERIAAAFDEARRQDAELDAKMEADTATERQARDVARGREEGASEAEIITKKNAEASMREAAREGAEIDGEESPEQLVAEAILMLPNDQERIESYEAMARNPEQGPEFVARVKLLAEAKSTKSTKIRNSVNDPEYDGPVGEDTYVGAGLSPHMFTGMIKTVGDIWNATGRKAIKGFRLNKAKSTIFEALRSAYGSTAYTNEIARRAVNDNFKTDDLGRPLTPADTKAVSLWREDPKYNSLPKHLTEVGQRVNEFYEVIEAIWKQMGMGLFPKSRINANISTIKGLKDSLADYAPEGKRHAAILEEIAGIELENERLAELRYHRHIVLKKPLSPEQAVAIDKGAHRGSNKERFKTTPTRALGRKYDTLEALEEDGFTVEYDFRVALADVFSYAQNKLMVSEFHENIIKQDPDLALPANEAPADWVELPGIEPYNRTRFKGGTSKNKVIGEDGKVRTEHRPIYGYKGQKWKVNPILEEAIRDFTESASESTSAGQIYDKFNTMMKQLKFYNPLIMTINNIQQGFAAAGFAAALNWRGAYKSVTSKDDFYLAVMRGDGFSTPPDIAPENFQAAMRADFEAHIENKTAFGRWLSRVGVKKLSDAWKLLPVHPNSAAYKLLRQATWMLDRVARVATVKALVARDMKRAAKRGKAFDHTASMAKAIVTAREFHGDYNLLRQEPSKWLRRLFLTPAYKTAMWGRLFPKITEDAFNGTKELLTGKEVTHEIMPLIRVLMATSAMTTAMAMLGYSWEDWYRFIKKDEDDEGETVVQMVGPFAEPFKVIGRATAGYEEGGALKAAERVIYNNLAALPKTAMSWWRNRNWKGDRIITPGAPIEQKSVEFVGFLLKETLPYTGQAQSWGDKEQSAFAKIANAASITMYHRDSSKRKWYKSKLDQKQKDLRAWAKEQAAGDPDLSAEYNEKAAKRYVEYTIALSETLKLYEKRLETALKGDAWLRFANQFDRMMWAHTKLDPGEPTLLDMKTLTELRALRAGPVRRTPKMTDAEFIERIMRKTFAGTFLREVADRE